MHEEGAVTHGDHPGAVDHFDGGAKQLGVAFVGGVARQVDGHAGTVRIDHVEGRDGAPGVADGRRDRADARVVLQRHAHGY